MLALNSFTYISHISHWYIHSHSHKCAHTLVPQPRVSPLQGCFKQTLCLLVPLHRGRTQQTLSHQTALGMLWLALTSSDAPLGVILAGNCGISWQALLPRQLRAGRGWQTADHGSTPQLEIPGPKESSQTCWDPFSSPADCGAQLTNPLRSGSTKGGVSSCQTIVLIKSWIPQLFPCECKEFCHPCLTE